ncbi:MAG: hypothetical protein A4E73_00984 [Syntrophaceae bacterium PtaU1.Bin231]|jgi:hypothetical protein|nr:MAG: hypothetical protein A4E67_00450 [Syntrophaceae bacterium PtaB.Bin038]OPY92581.1 MAG: hypothetical protein A4E73_00984 [Syntrophaceae bacterium PtaU1.Bin231]
MRKTILKHFFAVGLFTVVLLIWAAPVVAAGLTESEIQDLVFIREEEKLARDVYDALRLYWGSRVFSNIELSEQTHMDAIKGLLDRYGIPDPAEGRGYGEFANTELQDLYDTLVARGSRSLVEAYRVGILIEETDIRDLQEAMDRSVHVDIKTVYGNLLRGSQNHLKAFSSHLGAQGILIE